LVPVIGKDGRPKFDDIARPMFKMTPDDFCIHGFFSVIRVFGDDALEYRAVKRLNFSITSALEEAGRQVAEILK
jgi:hypothetical protein